MPNLFLEGLQRPAILQNSGSGLPDYSEANDGDVLQIESGEPTWGAVDALPEIEETDEGKVLAVDQGEAVWADAPSGLPEITEGDEGKVLAVVEGTNTIDRPLFAQQTAVVEGGASVEITSPQNLDKFVVGASVTVNVNGTDYTVTVADVDGNPAATLVSEPAENWMAVTHWSHDDSLTFEAATDGTYVISATIVGKELVAGWKAAEDGMVNLDVITTEVQTAAMTAAGNADTSGFFGVSLSMFGNETTVEIANLITEAARAGKISALGQTFTLVSSIIDEEYPPTAAGMEAFTTISFLVPVIALGLNKYYTLAVQIATGDIRDQQTDEYVPTLAVSCWAMKIANYPSTT